MKNSDKESIYKFYQQWFRAMETADIDEFLALLDEEFYLKGSNQLPLKDKVSLRKSLEQFYRIYSESVDQEIEEYNIFDSVAVVRISETVTLASKHAGKTTRLEGIHVSILKKQDGTWRLKLDVSSLNHLPPIINNDD